MAAGGRPGRKRDPGRDDIILTSTLAVLADHGYDGMTVDMVAEHARMARATVYRRWSTKAELVLSAVSALSRDDVDAENLPDTGSLRGDLIAMIRPFDDDEQRIHLRAVIGLLTMADLEEPLADAAIQAGIGPWVEVNRFLIERAVSRGEFRAPASLDTMAELTPHLFVARVALGQEVDRAHSIALIDEVLIPALGGAVAVHQSPPARPPRPS